MVLESEKITLFRKGEGKLVYGNGTRHTRTTLPYLSVIVYSYQVAILSSVANCIVAPVTNATELQVTALVTSFVLIFNLAYLSLR